MDDVPRGDRSSILILARSRVGERQVCFSPTRSSRRGTAPHGSAALGKVGHGAALQGVARFGRAWLRNTRRGGGMADAPA
jgi:hypothetical protein